MMRPRTYLLVLLAMIGCAARLPAQLVIVAFDAQQFGRQVQLQWTVGRGNTCEDLEVQHSSDGQNFNTVFVYPGVCGEATFEQTYSWTQTDPVLNADNYYRVNSNTGGVLSDTIVLRVVGYSDAGVLVAPNPAGESATLYFYNPANSPHYAELFDAQGKLAWQSEPTTGNTLQLALPGGQSGLYYFRLVAESGEAISGPVLFR